MKTYLVGGAVRDKLLNYPVLDRDWVVVGASAEHLLALGYTPVGADFPVFLHPKSKEEYALARTERKSGKGYKGFSFYAAKDVTLEQDLSRRDLTINAIAEDEKGQLTDPFNGKQDIADKVLRHVSAAFSEDPLRVLRVARFAARYAHLGFSVAGETLALMTSISLSGELQHLTRERVWQELERALGEKSPLIFFKILQQTQALEQLFPQLSDVLINIEAVSAQTKTDFEQQILQLSAASQRISWLFYIAQINTKSANLQSIADQFCERLRCQNSTRNLIKHSALAYLTLSNWDNTDSLKKLKMIQTADLLRSSEKTAPILEVVIALDFNRVFIEHSYLAEFETLLDSIRAIDHQTLIKQGFKGAQLGAEIKRLQLKHCSESSTSKTSAVS